MREYSREMLLLDDDTNYGGTSFHGETLGDLLDEVGLNIDELSNKEVGDILKECGCTIKPFANGSNG